MFFIDSGARKRSKLVDSHVAELRNLIESSVDVRAALGSRCRFILEATNNYYVPDNRSDHYRASPKQEALNAVPIIPLEAADTAWGIDPSFATYNSAQTERIFEQRDELGIDSAENSIVRWQEMLKREARLTKIRFPLGHVVAATTGTVVHPNKQSPYRLTSRPVIAYNANTGSPDVLAHEFVHCAQRTESPVIMAGEYSNEAATAISREQEAHIIHRDLLVASGRTNGVVPFEKFDEIINDFSAQLADLPN